MSRLLWRKFSRNQPTLRKPTLTNCYRYKYLNLSPVALYEWLLLWHVNFFPVILVLIFVFSCVSGTKDSMNFNNWAHLYVLTDSIVSRLTETVQEGLNNSPVWGSKSRSLLIAPGNMLTPSKTWHSWVVSLVICGHVIGAKLFHDYNLILFALASGDAVSLLVPRQSSFSLKAESVNKIV